MSADSFEDAPEPCSACTCRSKEPDEYCEADRDEGCDCHTKDEDDDDVSNYSPPASTVTRLPTAAAKPVEQPDKYPNGSRGDGGRPRLNIGNRQGAVAYLRTELGQGVLSSLLRRGNRLVSCPLIGERGYVPPKDEGAVGGPGQVVRVSADELEAIIEERFDVGRVEESKEDEGGKKSKHWRRALLPAGVTRKLLASVSAGEGAPNVRPLSAITHTPMVRADGSILTAPGYDTASRVLFLPDPGMGAVTVPDRPTPAQVAAARELVLFPVKQFPWVSENDLANWVGVMLTPLLRAMLPPPYMFPLVDAPSPGSGKTLLTKVWAVVHGMERRADMPKDDKELSKVIMTLLVSSTAPLVCFDNIRGRIHSSVLEALLTMADTTDRTLGRNDESLRAANDRVWCATGNNAEIGGDLARRTLRIVIDPRVPSPEGRTGFDCDPERWTRENRGRYVTALLTLVRAWVVAGRPAQPVDRSDDYAAWVQGVRGILAYCELRGTFADRAARHEESVDDAQFAELVTRIGEVMGVGTSWTTADLAERIGATHDVGLYVPAELLPAELGRTLADGRRGHRPDDSQFVASMAGWLRHRAGRWYRPDEGPQLTIRRLGKATSGSRKGAVLWSVEAADGSVSEPDLFE